MAGTAVKLEATLVLGLETATALQALERYKVLMDEEAYLLDELPVR